MLLLSLPLMREVSKPKVLTEGETLFSSTLTIPPALPVTPRSPALLQNYHHRSVINSDEATAVSSGRYMPRNDAPQSKFCAAPRHTKLRVPQVGKRMPGDFCRLPCNGRLWVSKALAYQAVFRIQKNVHTVKQCERF